MDIIVISCSLHPKSRSFILAQQVVADLAEQGIEVPLFDLREYDLPFCDATEAYEAKDSQIMIKAIEEATAVLLAVPIYNYDVNAAAKNLLEIGLRAWNNKVVGFLCAAGGRASYMSPMILANSLMLDFRCLIVPRFVYTTGDDFGDDREPTMYIANEKIKVRVRELANATASLATMVHTNKWSIS